MDSPAWLPDGGFEVWSGGNPAYWTFGGALSVAQEATVKRSGKYSLKATRSDGVTFSTVTGPTWGLPQGSWFYAGAWVQGTVVVANAVRLQVLNLRTGAGWDEATQSWIAGGSIFRPSRADAFALAAGWVPLFDPSFLPGDQFLFRLCGYWTPGESLYYDDTLLAGPFDHAMPHTPFVGLVA
jgi:hypothetical protein